MKKADCIFCQEVEKGNVKFIFEDDFFVSKWDPNPVTKGHALVITKRHIASFFKMTQEEVEKSFEMILKLKKLIDKKYKPNGYNIGVNCGQAAGQTVFHLHIHIIPRHKGDVKNPRGGVRHVIPEKGNY